mmetsp:Transcript_63814/g.164715  ORF Transcript_63814/g.164715 Transcript_63814/m.164715 type:complete len:96 (+) Transcript_63814:245-532(+)
MSLSRASKGVAVASPAPSEAEAESLLRGSHAAFSGLAPASLANRPSELVHAQLRAEVDLLHTPAQETLQKSAALPRPQTDRQVAAHGPASATVSR